MSVIFIRSVLFQFTHPGRGATRRGLPHSSPQGSFNSRTPGGVRLRLSSLIESMFRVSIHAPREGCDIELSVKSSMIISFNSRTPGGVRLFSRLKCLTLIRFQFTHPGRGATGQIAGKGLGSTVSIHAPREGCDTNEFSNT